MSRVFREVSPSDRFFTYDGVVKTLIYGDLSRGDSQHTSCIVETHPGTLLLGVYAYLYIYIFT